MSPPRNRRLVIKEGAIVQHTAPVFAWEAPSHPVAYQVAHHPKLYTRVRVAGPPAPGCVPGTSNPETRNPKLYTLNHTESNKEEGEGLWFAL